MFKITQVVKHLLITNVLAYALAHTPATQQYLFDWAIYPPPHFKPYQLISHLFMHSGTNHLIMNMMGLFFLGPALESRIGSKNFFILYFACGLAGSALPFLLHNAGLVPMGASWGASAATIGVSVGFATLMPNAKLNLMFIPIPIKAKFLIGGLLLFDIAGGIGNALGTMDTNIGHFAHLGGAIAAFLLTYFYFRRII